MPAAASARILANEAASVMHCRSNLSGRERYWTIAAALMIYA
jgi:hypothetical protein